MKDDDQIKFTPQLALDSECFAAHLPTLVRCKRKAHSERCAPYCAIGDSVPDCQLLYEMALYGNFKGLSQDGGQADFSPRLSLK